MAARPAVYHRAFDQPTKKEILSQPLIQKTLRLWRAQAESGPVVDFGWTTAPLAPAFHDVLGDQLRVLVIHCHPIDVAASLANMGTYKEYCHENYTLTPRLPWARYPQFADRWDEMSCFEKCLFRWLETTFYGLELPRRIPGLKTLTLGFDEVVGSEQTFFQIANFIGLPRLSQPAHSVEANKLARRSLERYPLRDEWRKYREYPELLYLARQLGYNMDEAFVEELIKEHQLPLGTLPFLRHVTGYWNLRSKVGTLVRTLGLLDQYPEVSKMRRQLSGRL
jgi:hypothetical protein